MNYGEYNEIVYICKWVYSNVFIKKGSIYIYRLYTVYEVYMRVLKCFLKILQEALSSICTCTIESFSRQSSTIIRQCSIYLPRQTYTIFLVLLDLFTSHLSSQFLKCSSYFSSISIFTQTKRFIWIDLYVVIDHNKSTCIVIFFQLLSNFIITNS